MALRAVWALRGAAGWAAKTQKLGLRWLRRYGWLAFPSSSRRLVDPLEAQLPFWGRKNGFYGKTESGNRPILDVQAVICAHELLDIRSLSTASSAVKVVVQKRRRRATTQPIATALTSERAARERGAAQP